MLALGRTMEDQYLSALGYLLEKGAVRGDRTGTGTRGIFGHQMRCDLGAGFPLLTTKKVHLKSIVVELAWFLQGRTDNQFLRERGVTIWDEWATPEQCARFNRGAGDLGPVYGKQWRQFGGLSVFAGEDRIAPTYSGGVDQLRALLTDIRKNPNSRRMIVTGWDPRDASAVALPPCHCMFQVYVQDGRLSLHNYMRSCDIFLGLPFNIASYAILTHLLAAVNGLRPGDLIISFGDLHLYNNHVEQARLQLSRERRPVPILELSPRYGIGTELVSVDDAIERLSSLTPDDVVMKGYDPHPAIKAEVSV